MTAIVGLVEDGRVHLGGDSAGVAGSAMSARADTKVFINHGYAMGFTSSFRMGQLLRYAFTPPVPPERGDLFGHMCIGFVDALRDALKAGGWAARTSEREEGGTFLVGVRGRLFAVHGDYQVAELVAPYGAVGCGSGYALGSLYSTASTGQTPRQRLRTALAAAEEHCSDVRGPFRFVSTRS